MIQAAWFAYRCFQLFREHQKHGSLTTFTASIHGVPAAAILFASGRDAWRVSDVATDYFARRGIHRGE